MALMQRGRARKQDESGELDPPLGKDRSTPATYTQVLPYVSRCERAVKGDLVDPVLQAAASALATKGVEALADGGRSAWAALVRLVRSRFGDDPTAEETLSAATAHPEDDAKVESLAYELARAERVDPQFGQQLRSLWEQADTDVRVESGGVVNQVSGTVRGNVVQARDITTGGVSFGRKPRRG